MNLKYSEVLLILEENDGIDKLKLIGYLQFRVCTFTPDQDSFSLSQQGAELRFQFFDT